MPDDGRRSSRAAGVRVAAGLSWGALYFAADVSLRDTALPVSHVVPWYPGAGIALVALVIEGAPAALLLLALRLGLAAWPRGTLDPAHVASAVGVAGAYLAGAMLVRRRVAWRAGIWRARDALWLTAGIAGAASLAAAASLLPTLAAGVRDVPTLLASAASFAAGDTAGAMVIAPLSLFVLLPALRARATTVEMPSRERSPDARRRRERAAQAAVVAATIAGGVVAHLHGRTTLGYACFLPLAWVALREGVRGAACVIAAYGLACGVTGLWLGLAPGLVLESQLVLLNLSVAGLLLGATRTAAVESESRYWHLLATAGEGIWHVDRAGRTSYLNARAAAMLARDPDEVVGRTLPELVTPEERARAEERVRLAATGVDGPWETSLDRPSAPPLPVLVRMRPVFGAATGEHLGAVAMLTDVSGWRDAERQRAAADRARVRAQELLEAVFRASQDAMLVFRGDGIVVDVNDAWLRGFGGRDALPSGMSLATLPLWAHPRDVGRLLRAVREAAPRGGTVRDFAIDIHRALPDGGVEAGHALVTVTPATVDGRNYHLLSCRDVTEERRAREGRERMRRFEELGRLAGGIAHDFNNLLTVVTSYAQLIRTAAARGQGVDPSDVDEIARAAARGTALTAHLLAFGRNQPIEPGIADLNDLLRASRGMVRPLLGPHVAIDYALADAPLPILVDAVQLDQVVLNLVVNAVDAMPDGGTVAIATARTRLQAAEIPEASGARVGGYATLDVTDTGHGMDEATRRRIFEPFFTTKDAGRGTGLGLAVVAGILRHAGGFARVRSSPGRGTTVSVFWPLAVVPARAKPAPDAPSPRDACVLVVDDDDALRQLVRRVLQDAGFQTAGARSGREALEQLATRWPPGGGPSIVVSDVTVPDVNGWELAATLADERPDVQVILMSALGDEAERVASLPAFRRPFIRKPFDAEALVRQVRAALERRDAGNTTV